VKHVPDATRHQLLTHPRLPQADRARVEDFLALCEGYAELERKVLGDVQYDLPVHRITIRGGGRSNLRREARRLAEAARELLELDFPVMYFHRALERHGVRIFEMPLSREVAGVFFFTGEVAPAFLLNSAEHRGAARFTLAHLYCHYMVDNDPYTPQICLVNEAEPDETQTRAHFFAEELLMPERELGPLLAARSSVEVLASYLDLPPSFISERLRAFGREAPESESDPEDRWIPSRGVVYPERLVRLAFEGMHEDRLDIREFAEALRLGRSEAIRLLRLSSAP
jgi:Zn-dependent peptidase ImmA (M78 family)